MLHKREWMKTLTENSRISLTAVGPFPRNELGAITRGPGAWLAFRVAKGVRIPRGIYHYRCRGVM